MCHAVRDLGVVGDWLSAGSTEFAAMRRAETRYPVLITPYYLALAESASPDDPILRQCLPRADELDDAYESDPFVEEESTPLPGLVHRYPDRALLVVSNECAVRCRHCLRKRMWCGGARILTPDRLDEAADYLCRNEIREVILSGGDPLLLPEQDLHALVRGLRNVPSVELIRIGSRLPVVLPQRLTPEFCQRLGENGPVWLAAHFNHPLELTSEACMACENLVRAGIPVVNQSVLLRGVNDTVECIEALCRGLVRMRVKPYYLFHGDPVRGTGHFRTGIDVGLRIMDSLRGRVSGLACPTFAIDLAGGEGKVVLEPDRRHGATVDGAPCFRGLNGSAITYD